MPTETDDLGLFGPDSVAWRVHADPAMVLGGLRALLLQTCHPVVMAGFAANSTTGTTSGAGSDARAASSTW